MGLFRKDPEIVRILDRLIERLKNLDDWRISDGSCIEHVSSNIKIKEHIIIEPKQIWIDKRYRLHKKFIRNAIKTVYRNNEVDKLHFVYDVIDGKYPHQLKRNILSSQKTWLDENSNEGEYVIDGGWIYFVDEPLAMAFKLQFD